MNEMDLVRQLLAACEDGDENVVQLLLDEERIDVNVADHDDTTALQVASVYGYENLVRFLIMRGAALDKANCMGWTPLVLASRYGHNNVVSLLLQNNVDINAKTKYGANALMLAARGGHLQTCKLLVEAGIDLMPFIGVSSAVCEFTALMAAALHGHDAVLRYLIDRGFDVNYRTPSTGVNNLMLAALNGHMATAQILIERGADPNLTNVNNCTPLQIASLSKKREVKGYLDRKTTNKPKEVSDNIKSEDIIQAAKRGNLHRIREILDKDPMQRDAASPQDGATPLMYAAMVGRLDIVQLLVEKGCDVNKQDIISGWTALMQAVYHGKKAVAKYLVNSGADVLIPAKNGCSAFDLASLLDDIDTDLYRLLASKAVQIQQLGVEGKPLSRDPRHASSPALNHNHLEHLDMNKDGTPRNGNGIRGWWNRMSNRFRNLKFTGTLRTSNRLAPMPVPPLGLEDTNGISSHPHTLESMSARSTTKGNPSNVSYETIMMATRKSASAYTMVPQQAFLTAANGPTTGISEKTLTSLIPPIHPPPSFEKNRPQMPPPGRKTGNSIGSLNGSGSSSNSLVLNNSHLFNNKTLSRNFSNSISVSTQSLAAAGVVNGKHYPFGANTGVHKDISPSSSGGASELTGASAQTYQSKGPSSASSSTLTAGSGSRYVMVYPADPSQYVQPPARPPLFLQNHLTMSKRPGLVLTGSQSISGSKASKARSHSSKDSQSTLTPSPAPNKKASEKARSVKSSVSTSTTGTGNIEVSPNDDPSAVLKKLSLEKYQSIFEDQEVDMEAFLTLNDQDLKDIGVTQAEPRRQILKAITQLSRGKEQERQRYQDTIPQLKVYRPSTPSGLPEIAD